MTPSSSFFFSLVIPRQRVALNATSSSPHSKKGPKHPGRQFPAAQKSCASAHFAHLLTCYHWPGLVSCQLSADTDDNGRNHRQACARVLLIASLPKAWASRQGQTAYGYRAENDMPSPKQW